MLKEIKTASLTPRRAWAESIRAKYAHSVQSVIEIGRELINAKSDLSHGEFLGMIRKDLPFKERTAQMYMAVANNQRLVNPEVMPLLPNALTTLYTLARIEPDVFDAMLAAEEIAPEKTNPEICLSADLYKVRVRGEYKKEPPAPKAKVVHFPQTPRLEIANNSSMQSDCDQTSHAEQVAIEGEYIPATRAEPRQQKERSGMTIDAGADQHGRKYQNTEQLVRGARRMLNSIANGKRVAVTDAIEWVACCDMLEIDKQLQ